MPAICELEDCQSELEVYQAGELTVLGFGGHDIPRDFNLTGQRDAVLNLVRRHRCTALALDLTSVQSAPRGLTGLLRCLLQEGLEVHLFNAASDIREMLELAKLDSFLHLHDIEL
ncbi:MAG TPA: anti-sigma factor antagonist [Planctomycetaceae bacterium]|nr:anti-sigma factor antagonist [Planctomycetaceae bacterium]